MRTLVDPLVAMKKSVLACLVVAAAGLLSMGALGGVLYAVAWPVTGLFFDSGPLWQGDGLWPVMILAGMLWPLSFLAAGYVNQRLVQAGWGTMMQRRCVYAFLLWLGAIILWSLFLSGVLSVH